MELTIQSLSKTYGNGVRAPGQREHDDPQGDVWAAGT